MVMITLGGVVSPTLASAQAEADELDQEMMNESREAYMAKVASYSQEKRKDDSVKRINRMKALEERIMELLDGVDDFERINCINDKLALVKGHINVSERAYGAMLEGEQAGDIDKVVHHYVLIAVSSSKVQKLADEATLCVPQTNNATEQGSRLIEVSPEVVPIDPVLPGGYTQLEDLFDDLYDTTGLTPIR